MFFTGLIIKAVEVERSQLWKDTGGLRQAKEILGHFDRARSKVGRSLIRFLRDTNSNFELLMMHSADPVHRRKKLLQI